jgi:predicted phage tail protein
MSSHIAPATMHRIHMWGELREKFLPEYDLLVSTVVQATHGLSRMVKGFSATVAKGHYRIILGDKLTGRVLNPDEAGMVLPPNAEIHVVPAIVGAGGGNGMGIGKIIIGVVLVAASFYAGGSAGIAYFGAYAGTISGAALSVGLSMAMSGAAMLLSPQAKAVSQQQSDDQNSFAFSGVQNTQTQGGAVPVCYGEFLVGSVLISAGISTQQLIN